MVKVVSESVGDVMKHKYWHSLVLLLILVAVLARADQSRADPLQDQIATLNQGLARSAASVQAIGQQIAAIKTRIAEVPAAPDATSEQADAKPAAADEVPPKKVNPIKKAWQKLWGKKPAE